MGGVSLWHGLIMAAAALGWGTYSLIGRGGSDPFATTAASFVGAVPIVALCMLLIPTEAVAMTPTGVLLAVVSGSLTSGLGYALWYSVLPHLGATRAALSQLTVPVIAVLGGVAFLSEEAGLRLILGCTLVIGGVALGLLQRPSN